MKRIVTVQDISCVGKCSLTVALPVISAMGIETAVLPTAVLSTHTAFKGFTFRDLTDDITPVCEHWKQEQITFDAIYTGYLGSARQLELMARLFSDFGGKDTLVFVDPCMADNGKLYPGFTQEFAFAMAKLAGKADVIVPNLTEASFMLGIPYRASGYDEAYIRDILKKLAGLGAKNIVVKGVELGNGKIGIMSYDPVSDTYASYFHEKLPTSFHGTGDIFASVCVGALMRGWTLEKAYALAADYVVEAIKATVAHSGANWYGVDFETVVPYLVKRLEENK
jgi:Pyridoxal/pyridoxine/pyridoxamine kinase